MLDELGFIFVLFSYILIFSSFSFSILKNFTHINIQFKKENRIDINRSITILSLALGFCTFFSFFSILNLNLHNLGFELKSNFYLICFSVTSCILYKKQIFNYTSKVKEILKELNLIENIKSFFQLSIRYPLITSLKFSILLQLILICYKLFLPVFN